MRIYLISVLTLFYACGSSSSQKPQEKPLNLEESYIKAADWLVKNQSDKGAVEVEISGKKNESVSVTSLTVYAFAKAPAKIRDKYSKNIDSGIKYILSKQANDGSWAESPANDKRTYATSLALMALCAVNKEKYAEQIKKAQTLLRSLQAVEGLFAGGHGYGDIGIKMKNGKPVPVKSDKADMSTTSFGSEAMKESEYKDKEYWEGIVKFAQKCQNTSENMDPEWKAELEKAGIKPSDDGGGFYTPDVKSIENYSVTDKDKKVINSYGSMTYALVKTYIYAGLAKDDHRVKAAIDWIRANYTVDYHPGFPYETVPRKDAKRQQGLYYYYMMMARCLDVLEENPFVTKDGKKHNWPKEIGEKLIAAQKQDGSFINDNPRWWEGYPAVVTPYVLTIYDTLMKNMK